MKQAKKIKAKEPVRLRFKKLTDGNQSIYLDTYQDGHRTYEFLKLYIVPELTDRNKEAKEYKTGIEISDEQFATLNLCPNKFHGDWNYSILPE